MDYGAGTRCTVSLQNGNIKKPPVDDGVKTRCTVSLQNGNIKKPPVDDGVKTQCTISLHNNNTEKPPVDNGAGCTASLYNDDTISTPEQYFHKYFLCRKPNEFGPQKNNLASIIGGYKSASTKKIRRLLPSFQWQDLFDDHLIRDSGELTRISNYIKNNPQNWKRA